MEPVELDLILEDRFRRMSDPARDAVRSLAELVSLVRPARGGDARSAEGTLAAIARHLRARPDAAAALRGVLDELLSGTRQVTLFVDTGIFPNTGFFTEIVDRVSRKVLPEVPDPGRLRDVLGLVFDHSSDADWVSAVDAGAWLDVLAALDLDLSPQPAGLPHAIGQVLESIQVLSYRIAAVGLEPELVHVDPDLERFESPFLALNVELLAFLQDYRNAWPDPRAGSIRDGHVHVLIEQCRGSIQRLRKRASLNGTSLALTFLLERLVQHLDRTEDLLGILVSVVETPDGRNALPRIVTLFERLVAANCRRNGLLDYWRQNVSILALRIADNTGRKGDHYIASDRQEYGALARSALVGGVLIAFMALVKILIGYAHLPPLTEALAICMNYGLGFVAIHMIHGTVATKQPAMTANAIAAAIGEDCSSRGFDCDRLSGLIARTTRSQLVAIIGNVGVAMPLALLLSLGTSAVFGVHIATPEKASKMLAEVHPLWSGSFFYAGIAGFWLFLSGLATGFYDNVCVYRGIPERLTAVPWMRRLMPAETRRRFADYVRENLGALAGNFLFGFMLGGSTAFGTLTGVPFDIRHIAFSAANIGFAVAGTGLDPTWGVLLPAMAGVALIGAMNLGVSFALALTVALRARRVSFAQRRLLLGSLASRLARSPREFLLPPREP